MTDYGLCDVILSVTDFFFDLLYSRSLQWNILLQCRHFIFAYFIDTFTCTYCSRPLALCDLFLSYIHVLHVKRNSWYEINWMCLCDQSWYVFHERWKRISICVNQMKFSKIHMQVIRPIVDVYVTCCVEFVILRYRTLTSSSTVIVHTVHCILTTKVPIVVWPGILLPCRLIKC